MSENINKIWGERRRVHLDDKNEIDLLYLKKDRFCSSHSHSEKINKFLLISGSVVIDTEYGSVTLEKNDIWFVYPPIKHRFRALENSVLIEFAFVKKGKINSEDINRESLGGKIINGEEMTIDELKKKGLLEF